MERGEFLALSSSALNHIEGVLGDLDFDGFDVELGGDVLTLSFGDGAKFIANAHSAAGQVWLAAGRTAWHFDYQPESKTWVSKRNGDELMSTLAREVGEKLGTTITL